MKYSEEFRNKVLEEQGKLVEKYKEFLEDHVLLEAAQSSTGNIFINAIDYEEQFLKQNFLTWLESEGFTVTQPSDNGDLLIQFT